MRTTPENRMAMTRSGARPLAAAFEQTDYHVQAGSRGGENWYTVNIGAPCPAPLRRWLTEHCAGPCAWIVTAYNPWAEQRDAAANRQRDAALKAWLDAAGHGYTATDSRARANDWPAEPGVCILDMDEGLARALALRFGQAAMVAVPVDGPVQLVWIDA